MGGGEKAELADSNDVLAQLGGRLHKHSGEDLHARFGKAVDQARALVGVTLSSAEALTSEDADTLFNGGRLLHEVGNAGHHSGAVVAGPLTFLYSSRLLFLQRPRRSQASPDPMKAG